MPVKQVAYGFVLSTSASMRGIVRLTFRITEFLDFVHCPELQILEYTTFRKLDPFPSSGEERETHPLLGPLGRANFYHWTMDKVQKPIDSECYTPSSEPFGIYIINLVLLTAQFVHFSEVGSYVQLFVQ
jgi:hypothetical protein